VTLATILLKLWKLRLWVAIGVVLGVFAAAGSIATSHTTVYANASTQMLVDSPDSALANAGVDLTGYVSRANVFARLATSAEALQYIGQAAGIPGNLIAATGPTEINGSAIAAHAPVAIQGGKDLPAPATYKLSFLQNPDLTTVDVYAEAPTTAQALRLANGAVTGLANFVNYLDGSNVPISKRIEIRQLGGATGGIVDSGASKKIALLIFCAVLAMWCGIVLFASRLGAQLRAAKQNGIDDDPFAVAEDDLMPAHAAGMGNSEPLSRKLLRGQDRKLPLSDYPQRFVPAPPDDRFRAEHVGQSKDPSRQVDAAMGAGAADGQTLDEFEADLERFRARPPYPAPHKPWNPTEQHVREPREDSVRDEVGLRP
jgi:hypothetical protein